MLAFPVPPGCRRAAAAADKKLDTAEHRNSFHPLSLLFPVHEGAGKARGARAATIKRSCFSPSMPA
jgi:hypothetical protein